MPKRQTNDMKPVLSDDYIQSRYAGLDLYKTRKRVFQDFPEFDDSRIEVRYVESSWPRFTVLKGGYDKSRNCIQLQVASGNPIRHLSSQFQDNDFLRGFLMIFQHIMNDTTLTLDNMHEYFRPMESPAAFLPVLADWFGVQLDMLGGEAEARRFLQYAIPLYRCRGTARGLRAHLAIVSGVVPEIIEGQIPYKALVIGKDAGVDANLFEADGKNSFTVYFPVLRDQFEDALVHRLSLIIQKEKPVHTRAYIGFKEVPKVRRTITRIDASTVMDDRGITI